MLWEMMSIEPFAEKWKAFGWNVHEVDGHDIEELARGLHRARWITANGKPNVIICHTVKGKGIEDAEFNYKWHTHAPEPGIADKMLREVSRNYGRPEEGYSRLQTNNVNIRREGLRE